MATFHVYKDAKGEWRWRLRSTGNNKVIADSGEGYAELASCEQGIELVKAQAPTAEVVYDKGGVPLIRR